MSSEISTRQRRRVLVIITGGTICMKPSAKEGWSMTGLSCSTMADLFDSLPTFQDPSLPEYEILEWEELLDSSDVSHEHWAKMSEQIRDNYERFDGFVILHGTDSLAFTSSALSFIFEKGLTKTIVVTGAMLPVTHLNTDALRNVTVSMIVAAYSELADVLVCFGTRILKGNRVVKTNCTVMDAFDTPNYPHIGQIGMDITMNSQNWLRSMLDVLSDEERSRLINRVAPNSSSEFTTRAALGGGAAAGSAPCSSRPESGCEGEQPLAGAGAADVLLDAARAAPSSTSPSRTCQSMKSNRDPYNDGDHPSYTNQLAQDGSNSEKFTNSRSAEKKVSPQIAANHHWSSLNKYSDSSNLPPMAKCNLCGEVSPPYHAADLPVANTPGKSIPSVTSAMICAAVRHHSCPNIPPSKRGCHEDRECQTLLDMSPTPRVAADPNSEEFRPPALPGIDSACADTAPLGSLRKAGNCSCAKETFIQVRSLSSSVSSPLRRCVPEIFTKLLVDHVCVLRVTPSFDPIILRQLAAAEREPFGVILQLYGTGTAPSNPRFLKAVQFAINSGVTIVAVTQCTSGSCSLMTYANGVLLHNLGVIEGKDLTTEAAITKLAYLFGKGYKDEELRLKMESNLNGELCPTVYKITGQATLKPTQTSPSNMLEHNKHFRLSAQGGVRVCTHIEDDKNEVCADPKAPRNTDVSARLPATSQNYRTSLSLNPNH